MKRSVFFIALLALAVPAGAQQQGHRSQSEDVAGTRWRIVEIAGTDVSGAQGYTIDFAADRLSGRAGCNSFNGPYVLGRTGLTAGPLAMTRMACPPPRMAHEQVVTRILAGPAQLSHPDRRTLLIRGHGGTIRLLRADHPGASLPPAPQNLAGTHWVLVEADGRRVRNVRGYEPVTLVFDGRRLAGGSGCNSYGAPYRVRGRRAFTVPVMATQRGCAEPVRSLERRLFDVLGSPFEFEVGADGDLLISKQGRVALRFERLPPPPPPPA